MVANDYQWIGAPPLAAIWVYVDGRNAGIAPLGESLTVPVEPGRHRVRVRLWWFLSPRVEVDAKPGRAARLSADIPRELSLPRRFMLGTFRPFHTMSLKERAPR